MKNKHVIAVFILYALAVWPLFLAVADEPSRDERLVDNKANARHWRGGGGQAIRGLAEEYRRIDGKSEAAAGLEYDVLSTPREVEGLLDGKLAFGGLDVAAANYPAIEAMGKQLRIVPVAATAYHLAYHLEGVDARLTLNAEAIAGIYSGSVTKWSDDAIKRANPKLKLPDKEIVFFYEGAPSAANYIISSYLSQVSESWKRTVGAGLMVKWPGGVGTKGSRDVAHMLRITDGSIGCVRSAHQAPESLNTVILINNEGKAVTDSVESVHSALLHSEVGKTPRAACTNVAGKDSYPLVGVVAIIIPVDLAHADPARKALIESFLQFALAMKEDQLAQLGLRSLPNSLAEQSRRSLAEVPDKQQ